MARRRSGAPRIEEILGAIPLLYRIHVQKRGLCVRDARHRIFTDERRPNSFGQST